MSTSVDGDCKLILLCRRQWNPVFTQRSEVISIKLSKVLENCSDWLIDNKLSLHLGKTECILFGPSRKLDKEGQFEIKCHNHIIKASDQVKYLGVTILK
jgi:hypothetical protein